MRKNNILFNSCKKEEYSEPSLDTIVKKELNKDEKLLKDNPNKTAIIL